MVEKIVEKTGIETVIHDQETFAIIIRASYSEEGISFLTPNDFPQQLGYMNRPAGHLIEPHIHKQRNDYVHLTNETLFIRSGKVRVDFYTQNKEYFDFNLAGSYKGEYTPLYLES